MEPDGGAREGHSAAAERGGVGGFAVAALRIEQVSHGGRPKLAKREAEGARPENSRSGNVSVSHSCYDVGHPSLPGQSLETGGGQDPGPWTPTQHGISTELLYRTTGNSAKGKVLQMTIEKIRTRPPASTRDTADLPAMPSCGICKDSRAVRQAHRRNIDGLLRLLGCYAFRCDGCSSRFYRFFKPRSLDGSFE